MDLILELKKFEQHPITTQLLLGLLKDYSRPYDKIDKMVEKGYLVQISRGLYIPAKRLSLGGPEPFLIANHLYGPSYISLDTALSYWGMIPERVFEITSVTSRLSKTFRTKVGVFTYAHIPLSYYSIGMQALDLTNKQTVLIACKEKALCDKIICSAGVQLRSPKQALTYLQDDLRIVQSELQKLNLKEMRKWLPVCRKRVSIEFLIEALERL